jgi:large subunit ribosomal protein L22
MEAKATLRYVRISPRKARLIVDMIRGKSADEAKLMLKFHKRHAAQVVEKLLDSALANATVKGVIDVDTLFVKTAFVDGAPVLKRWRPRAHGRATRILKRSSHITLVLDEK